MGPGFPRGGTNPYEGCQPLFDFVNFCWKLHENNTIWAMIWVHVPCAHSHPPRSANYWTSESVKVLAICICVSPGNVSGLVTMGRGLEFLLISWGFYNFLRYLFFNSKAEKYKCIWTQHCQLCAVCDCNICDFFGSQTDLFLHMDL